MKVVLTIAGSDSSGGAGIQADLKTFEAFGVFGCSAITVLTAQNTTGVQAIHPLESDFIVAQIQSVLNDFEVSAIKIGMLYDASIIHAVASAIEGLNIPIVLDPVCVSKAGSVLLKSDAIDALRALCDHVTISTPNLHEAYQLYGYIMEEDTPPFLPSKPVLIKNHTIEDQSTDILFISSRRHHFSSKRLETNNLHGTGCSYSSAIAANLALGYSLEESIERSKRFITEALIAAPSIGHGPGPINHKAGGEHVA